MGSPSTATQLTPFAFYTEKITSPNGYAALNGKVRRPGGMVSIEELRQLIAIRLDVEVLRWLKALAAKRRVPYQSLINELLAGEMRKAE
jgi:uncharacterized protein (DUF4415 family)